MPALVILVGQKRTARANVMVQVAMSNTMTNLGAGGITLLVLALLCWVFQTAILSSVAGQQVHGDAVVGQGMAWLAAMVFAGFTWLWLGGLLLKAGVEDRMPAWADLPATFLYLLSAAAVAAAFFLLAGGRRTWPVITPALLPPILVFYVCALYQPSWGAFFSSPAASRAVWGVVLILAVAPLPACYRQLVGDHAARIESAKARDEWKVREGQRKRAENLEKLKTMTPEMPLTDWYPLLDEEGGVTAEAFEALRHVERRQTDIEFLLTNGVSKAMMLIPDLDLKATPELCEAARTFMLDSAKSSRVRPKQDPREYGAGGDAETSLNGIRWLLAHGCNCDEGIAALEASVRSYLDSPDRKAALAALAALRENPAPAGGGTVGGGKGQ
jgi:hypothetical protein